MTGSQRQDEYNRLLTGQHGNKAITALVCALSLFMAVVVWQVAVVIPDRVGKVEKTACQLKNVHGCRQSIDGIIKSITPEQKQELLRKFGAPSSRGATGATGATGARGSQGRTGRDGRDAP